MKLSEKGVIQMKKLAILGILSLSALFLFSCKGVTDNTTQPVSSQVPTASNASQGIKVGTPAPDFTLNDLTGKQISLSEYQGKVVYLNFWATW